MIFLCSILLALDAGNCTMRIFQRLFKEKVYGFTQLAHPADWKFLGFSSTQTHCSFATPSFIISRLEITSNTMTLIRND